MEKELLEKIKRWLTVFDFPSGVVLGIHTLVIIGLSIAAFVAKRSVDTSIITIYGINLSWFAGHKISTTVTTLVTQSNVDTPGDKQ